MAIAKCTCEHEGQDKIHGKGYRVHTPTMKPKGCRRGEGNIHCTVCGNEKPHSAAIK